MVEIRPKTTDFMLFCLYFLFFSLVSFLYSPGYPFYDYLIIFSKNDSDLGEKAREYFSLQIYV